MKANRLDEIDAARGTAMLFVCFAHFGWIYFFKTGSINSILMWKISAGISMIASPTFLAISGLMLGYLYEIKKEKFDKISEVFIDKGLFLVTIGHLMIFMAHIPISENISEAIRYLFITDTIGFCIILGPKIIKKLNLKIRLITCLSLYFISWIFIFYVNFNLKLLVFLQHFFFGTLNDNFFTYNFPLIPWFSFYLLHTNLGQKIAFFNKINDEKKIRFLFLKTFIIYFAIGFTLFIVNLYLKFFQNTDEKFFLYILTSPFQKLPPSPAYFLIYGGAGIFILYFLFSFKKIPLISTYIKKAAMVGKTSLFVFILQYYVYFFVIFKIKFNYIELWPVIFIMSIILIYFCAQFWLKKDFNRFLTLRKIL